MKKILIFAVMMLAFLSIMYAQTTYYWIGANNASWQVAGNWNPIRSVPAANDILIFNDSSTKNITAVPTQTIGTLEVLNNTNITLSSTASIVLTIAGGTGDDLIVTLGSSLNVNSTTVVNITLSGTATGSISGSMTFTSASGTPGHRLIANALSSLVFANGATFTFGPNVSGNAFGNAAGSSLSVIFQSGAYYVSRGGANPFGIGQPGSVVVFQAGSWYRHEQSGGPAFSGRTYAGFEHNHTSTVTITGTAVSSVNHLFVIQGGLNYNMTTGIGHAVRGNVYVNTGATLNFNPVSSGTTFFAGTTPQVISGGGTLTLGANAIWDLTNPTGMHLSKMDIANFRMNLNNNPLMIDETDITLSGNANITSTTPLSVSKSHPPLLPNYINKQWSITGSASADVNIFYAWSAADDGGFTWGDLVPAVWKGGVQFTPTAENYDVSGETRWLRVTAPLSSSKDISQIGRADGESLEEEVLPVILSTFTATMSAQNFVRLQWITQSEQNCTGFYIYRGKTGSLTDAVKLDGFVAATNTSQQHIYFYDDLEISENGTYLYWLESVDFNGIGYYHGPVTVHVNFDGDDNPTPNIPLANALSSVYPNPFNPSAFIAYSIAAPTQVQISIFNSRGQLVRNLYQGDKGIGNHRIEWDGTDDNGTTCSTGFYLIRLTAGKDSFVRKAVLMK